MQYPPDLLDPSLLSLTTCTPLDPPFPPSLVTTTSPPFSLLHSTSTQIYTHAHPDKNIFILTHTLCSGQGSHTHIHAHFLIYTHAFAHVMFGSPWDPDEWNLSVGSRYTEHHRGSLSSQKSTKPQSRSTVPSHAHTWPCTHMCLDLFTHTPATHREVEEKWNKETEVTEAHKNVLNCKDKIGAGQCVGHTPRALAYRTKKK